MRKTLGVFLAIFACSTVAFGQGINPVSPNSNDMIRFVNPAFSDPSSLYTTPSRIFAGGTKPTLTGNCAVVATTQSGGALAGSFAIPAGNCVATTTITASMPTAVNGWSCDAHNLNTPTSIVDQTATSTTSVTFTIRTVTSNAADVVVWKCVGY